MAAVTITALAAMVAGVIALQPDHDITDSVTELVENAKRDDGEKAVIADSGNGKQTPKADKKKNPKRKPLKGIPMIVQFARVGMGQNRRSTSGDSSGSPNADENQAAELALVSAQVGEEMQGYWEAVGINPTSEATAKETVARLTNRTWYESLRRCGFGC